MKHLILVLTATLVIFSCSTKPKEITPSSVLENCIIYHGGLKNWRDFNSSWSMTSNSIHTKGLDERITITVDVQKDEFCYENAKRDVEICFNDTICTLEKPSGIKDNYSWTKNFYTYVWGLPMKLKDQGTVLCEDIGSVEFNSQNCHEIYTHYDNDSWTYYINSNTSRLEGIKFVMNADSTKGEIVEFIGETTVAGIRMPKKRLWFDLEHNPIGWDEML